jgi:hypothetical protein
MGRSINVKVYLICNETLKSDIIAIVDYENALNIFHYLLK